MLTRLCAPSKYRANSLQRYPEDLGPSAARDRERNAVAMEEYLTKIKEYSKDNRNSKSSRLFIVIP
jgi:hypothetical protein